jgi:hypothetical protein
MNRSRFLALLAVCSALFAAVIKASDAALPWMASILAPRGINAGFALNLIWFAAGVLFVAALMMLIASRLTAVGRPRWIAAIAVLPLAALALVNDAIFLVSRSFVLPPALNWTLVVAAAMTAIWVLAQCLIEPQKS